MISPNKNNALLLLKSSSKSLFAEGQEAMTVIFDKPKITLQRADSCQASMFDLIARRESRVLPGKKCVYLDGGGNNPEQS